MCCAVVNKRFTTETGDIRKYSIFSMDVRALYPSLNHEDVLECVMDMMERSSHSLEIIDKKEMCKYLAIILGDDEIKNKRLIRFLPTRYNQDSGRVKPSVAFLDTEIIRNKQGEKEKWIWDEWIEPNGEILQQMSALMIRELVRATLSNHVYIADGKLYLQLKGGPIGLKITTVLAELLMSCFDSKYGRKLTELGLNPKLRSRYVDDENAVTETQTHCVCQGNQKL